MENPDWLARFGALASLAVAGAALWLNWKKHDREIEAMRPQVGLRTERRNTREWQITMTVMNPCKVPIAWRQVRAVRPEGLGILSEKLVAANAELLPTSQWEFRAHYFVEGYPIIIEPNASASWVCIVRINDRFAVPDDATPVIEPVIDGFDYKPSRLRRIAKWIWPSAIRM